MTPPATAEVIELSGGARLGYARYGDPRGRPLLFFHGWPGSRLQGAIAHEAAHKLGWCLVAPDRPGIGLTTCPEPHTLTSWPSRVVQLMERLGWDDCHLLAISGGAPSTLACATAFPQHFRGVGIVCGAVSLSEAPSREGLFPLFRLLLSLDRNLPVLSPWVLRAMSVYLRLLPPSQALAPQQFLMRGADRQVFAQTRHRRRLADALREAYRQGPEGVLCDGRTIAKPWNFNWRQAPQKVPTRFWHGDADGTIPLSLARWAVEEMDCSEQLRIWPDEGHFSLPINHSERILYELGQLNP